MSVKRVKKEALITETIRFVNSDQDNEFESISPSFMSNVIDIISLDGLDGNPVIPTDGSYSIFAKTDKDGGFKRITNRSNVEALKTGGSLLADGVAEGSEFIGLPLEIKIVPSDVVGATHYRVNIKQSCVQLRQFNTPTDYYTEVTKGNIPGSRIILINGVNPDVDIGPTENIWGPGGLLVYPTAGEQWELVFADPNDTAAGTGAREVTVRYLDDTYTEQSEVVASNGGTVVMTATDSFRFIEAEVTAKGSGAKNAGDIDIQVAGGGDDRGVIITKQNVTLNGFYTTPANKKAYVIFGYTSIQKNKDASMGIFVTTGDNGIFKGTLPLRVYQNSFSLLPPAPIGPLIEKTDLQVVVTSAGNDTEATLVLQILEVDNV